MVYDLLDIEVALCFLEHSLRTHEEWARFIENPGDDKVPEGSGIIEFHQECILEYEFIIDVFKGLVEELE